MSSNEPLPPVYTAQSKRPASAEKTLRRFPSTLVVTFVFLFLLIAPWVFLNVLNARSYRDVAGNIGDDVAYRSEQMYRAAVILNTVAAVLTLPVLSKLFNHATVAFAQRRHPDQRVNVSQLLSLADAPWSRLSPGITTTVLGSAYGALILVAIGFIQLILQSALVNWEEVQVATWFDAPGAKTHGSYSSIRYEKLGYDPTPDTISRVPAALVIKGITAKLSTESNKGPQPLLWYEGPAPPSTTFPTTSVFPRAKSIPYAAAFPPSVDTGVLRYHVMRLNTSVQCEAISRDQFPDTCLGPEPLYGNLSLPSLDDDSNAGTPDILVRWCVPGNMSASPWALNRDRQDISEDLFVDAFLPDGAYSEGLRESFTTHCWANTTRGYFELPNSHTNFTAGPLIERWNSSAEWPSSTNDLPEDNRYSSFEQWPYLTNYPYGGYDQSTPGPLTTAMMSMLGEESWMKPLQNISVATDPATIKAIYTNMCTTGGIPFLLWENGSGFSYYRAYCGLSGGSSGRTLYQVRLQAYGWFDYFSSTGRVNETLTAAAFFANEATLTRAATPKGLSTDAGYVYTSAGVTVHKPSIPLPAVIVISILLGVEVLAVLALLAFIYRKPTFTSRLDALVIATIGAQLSATGVELPHLNEAGKAWHKILQEHDGVIGFNHGGLAEGEARGGADGEAASGHTGDDGIELDDVNAPRPSRILIVGGIGSL
ncbi:hypothetical protein ANO14919_101040 [Xylariales sp. No.14919]|nr:hypothetical protein ANO14919_101040 [Xylariales sp. No.14919]